MGVRVGHMSHGASAKAGDAFRLCPGLNVIFVSR